MAPRNHHFPLPQWKTLLITIGDSFDSVESDIFTVVNTITSLNTPDNDKLIDLFLRCVESFTFKTGIYASIAGILNSKLENSFSKKICEKLQQKLKDYLISDRPRFILLLRFYIALHCVKFNVDVFDFLSKLLSLLDQIQDKIISCNDNSSLNYLLLADNISYSILCSIPWFDRHTFTLNYDEISKVISKCTDYLISRNKSILSLKNNPSDADLESFRSNIAKNYIKKLDYCGDYYYLKCYNPIYDGQYSDVLSQSLEAIKSFVASDHKSTVTYRFYQMPSIKSLFKEEADKELFIDNSDILSSSWDGVLTRPIPVIKTCKLISKDISLHDIWIFQEHIMATIECFKNDCKQCAAQLLRIPLNSNDKETLIVRVVLNLMLEPLSDEFFIGFNTLLLCHMSTLLHNIDTIVDLEIKSLFDLIPNMDYHVLNTFIKFCAYWYSFSLSKISLAYIFKFKDIQNRVKSNPQFISFTDQSTIQLLSDEDRLKLMDARIRDLSALLLNERVPCRIKLLEQISRLLFLDKYYQFVPVDLRPYIESDSANNFLGMPSVFEFSNTYEFEAITKLLHIKKMATEEYTLINSRIQNFINNMIGKPALTESATKISDHSYNQDSNIHFKGASGVVWTCNQLVEIALCALFQLSENKSQSHINRLIDNHWNFLSGYSIEDDFILGIISKIFSSNPKRLELVIEHLVSTNSMKVESVLQFIFTLPITNNYSFWIDLIDIVLTCKYEYATDCFILFCDKIKQNINHEFEFGKYLIQFVRRWHRHIDYASVIKKIKLSRDLDDVIVMFAHLPKEF